MAGGGANGKLVPKLIENALKLALKSEEIIDRVPTGHSKHGQLPPLTCSGKYLDHAFIYVK
jgi:hypothetical protein